MPVALAAILAQLLPLGVDAVLNVVALFQKYKANNLDPSQVTPERVAADLKNLGVDIGDYDSAGA